VDLDILLAVSGERDQSLNHGVAILAQDGTKSDPDRALYNTEFQQLKECILNAAVKDFNGVGLFSGAPLKVTIDSEGNSFDMDGIDLTATFGAATALATSISTAVDAADAVGFVTGAITRLASNRAFIGAYQSRLNFTAEQLQVNRENLAAASSRIQDVDVAEESTQYARFQILVQSGTAMLAQANAMPQSALRLLE
jgi:flagellin